MSPGSYRQLCSSLIEARSAPAAYNILRLTRPPSHTSTPHTKPAIMVTRTPKLKAALPRDWIGTMNMNAVETSPAQEDDMIVSDIGEGEGEPEIPDLPGVPNHQSSFLDESFNVIESASSAAPIFSGSTAAVPVAESGTSPVPLSDVGNSCS
jgi:hypothetical protein